MSCRQCGVRVDPERLARLRRIGIDEFSYRKRHHYLTVVVDYDKRRMVWAGKGRSAETLEASFDLLGPSGCEHIALVTEEGPAPLPRPAGPREPPRTHGKDREIPVRHDLEEWLTDGRRRAAAAP